MEGLCRYCNQYKKLCKAHIIPETFYKIREKSSLLGLSADGTIDCIHSQNGLKDNDILCSECDAILGKYDKYGAEIFKNQILKNPIIPPGYCPEQLYLLEKSSFDYSRLRKFFISLVWRASISKLCDISLGKYENIALKILKDEIPDDTNLFHPIIIHRPERYKFKDFSFITMQRLFNQKSILVSFPEYQVSIITNCSLIKNNQTFKNYFFNTDELVVFETAEDINKTQNLITTIANRIRNKHNGKLPNLRIK